MHLFKKMDNKHVKITSKSHFQMARTFWKLSEQPKFSIVRLKLCENLDCSLCGENVHIKLGFEEVSEGVPIDRQNSHLA